MPFFPTPSLSRSGTRAQERSACSVRRLGVGADAESAPNALRRPSRPSPSASLAWSGGTGCRVGAAVRAPALGRGCAAHPSRAESGVGWWPCVSLRSLLISAHVRGVPVVPRLQSHLRYPCGTQRAGARPSIALARRLPECPHPLVSPGRPTCHDGHFPGARRGGAGRRGADFHESGVESYLCVVPVADHNSYRPRRGSAATPLGGGQTLAPFGTSFCRTHPRVELDDELGRGLVLLDGGGELSRGAARFSFARPGTLPSKRRRKGRTVVVEYRSDQAGDLDSPPRHAVVAPATSANCCTSMRIIC